MKSYNQEFKNIIIIYFDQSITSDKYILLRFIIYYYYYYYSTDLHIRIPISLDQMIETFYNILKKRTKTDAIKELLEIGLFTFENWFQFKKEPNKLQELHRQMEEGKLVDSIQDIDPREFEIMFNIFKTEYKARYGCKAGNLISLIEKEGA